MVNLPSGLTGNLFTPEWQAANAAVVERAMIATIVITEGKRTYDSVTDTWSGGTVVYTGKARVQPLRSASWKTQPGNDTPVQTFLVSIPISSTVNLKIAQEVRVTASPLNPSLLTFRYVVTEITDSSNPIERTFYCIVDQETRL